MKLFKFIKDLISPKKCYSCKKEGHFLCLKCLSTMSNFNEICYVCKEKSPNFNIHTNCKKNIYYDKIIVLSHYKNNIIKKLIKHGKYYSKKDVFEDFGLYLSDILIKNIGDLNYTKSDFIILPTPMYFIRKFYRGYNQSEILANYIGINTKIDIENKLIKRVRNTRQQSKLNKQDRIKNLDKAFKIDKSLLDKLDKKVFIIVDDVISTGTTINEISKILRQNGVKNIIGLVIASN